MLAIAPGALTALVQEMSAIGELQYHQRVRDLREMESQETLSFLDASDHMGCEPGRTFQLSAVTRQQCVLCIYAVPDRRVAYFYRCAMCCVPPVALDIHKYSCKGCDAVSKARSFELGIPTPTPRA